MQRQFVICLILASLLCPAHGQEVRGTVFNDTNGNLLRDHGEPGIPGVVISDQDITVVSDARGGYSLESRSDLPYIILSQPTGYTGKYYYPKAAKVDFPLVKGADQSHFKFIHASDTHIDSLNLPRMERFRKMADSLGVAFVVISGDLVRDALRVDEQTASTYYRLFAAAVGKFSMPVYSSPGNHELFGIERDKSLVGEDHPLYGKKMYRHFLGPDYYSFNYGGIHFMGMAGVDFQNLYYYGGVDSLQLRWIANDLKFLPAASPVITFNHIPFISAGFSFSDFESDIFYGPQLLLQNGKLKHRHLVFNFDEIQERIGKRPYPLALSGHYHVAMEASIAGGTTLFAQTAAITGPDRFDYHGFPARSGFTLYEIQDGKLVSAVFVPLNLPGK